MKELTFLYVVILGFVLEPVASQKEIFRCFEKNSDKSISVTLSCKPGQLINVHDAKYGYNKWDACLDAVAPSDCTENLFEANNCTKKNTCCLKVKNIYSFACGGEINYFMIVYSCIGAIPRHKMNRTPPNKHLFSTTPKRIVESNDIPQYTQPRPQWKRPMDPYEEDNSEQVVFAICLTVTGIALAVCLTVIFKQCWTKNREKGNATCEMLPDEISIILTEMQRRPSADGGPPDTNDSKDSEQSTELNPDDSADCPTDIRQKLQDCNRRWNLYNIVRQQIWRLKSRAAPEGHSPPIGIVSQSMDHVV